jgi:hypothetical protein
MVHAVATDLFQQEIMVKEDWRDFFSIFLTTYIIMGNPKSIYLDE